MIRSQLSPPALARALMILSPTRLASLLLAIALSATSVGAQGRGGRGSPPPPVDLSLHGLANTLRVRPIGPAAMSGRIEDIAVASRPGAPGGLVGTVFYVGAAGGGVWKTTNGGQSFAPVFDRAGVSSIGAVAVAPSNPEIVWVGTGEDNNQRSSSYGDGVYRSVDGGRSFEKVGLERSQHVGRIRIHPTDPDIVYVAAVGPLWGPGGERGVFRTRDGGESWENVLSVDEHTGAADLVLDPSDPDVIYVSMQQRERRAYSYVSGGPGTGIWKSTDGGDHWRKLEQGLPASPMGRIGLDVSRSDPQVVYAVIEGSEQGVYRSVNGGRSWSRRSDIASIPWYFGEIRVDPTDENVVYHLGVSLQRSTDGGANWEEAAPDEVHPDMHALWIDPGNSDQIILGNDGGLFVTHDRGDSWDFAVNLPVSQFYAIAYDFAEPFFGLSGGLQDNNTWGGPSRTRNAVGIRNSDWYVQAGGDGFYAQIDPTDPDVAYVESQNGGILRYDRRTGDRKGIRPEAPDGQSLRFNWSAPIKISPWDPNTLYFAANVLFKSSDRGDSWEQLGEDLTQAIDRDSLPMFGAVPGDDAVSRHSGTAEFGNVSDIDASTLERGLLVTGADDGTIAISTDDGRTWRKQTHFPGVPDTTYVSKVRLSQHDPNVVYATFDGHRSNDFRPYVLKSTDQGRTWSSISGDLPAFGNVRAFAEHPRNPDLLFVGTEIAPFVSVDGGRSWARIENGMPPVRIDDLKIHPRENSLIIATHGRGLYLIDDLGPLEHLQEARAAEGPYLFPVKPEMAFVPDISAVAGWSGSREFLGENPPVGTNISYLLTRAERGLSLEILDGSGNVVRTLDADGSIGLHHVLWDFRSDAPYAGPPVEAPAGRGAGRGGFGGGPDMGPMVVPGDYVARLTVEGGALERPVEVKPDPAVTLTAGQLEELYRLRRHHLELGARLTIAERALGDALTEVRQAQTALEGREVPEALTQLVASLDREITDLQASLGGGGGGRGGRGGGRGGGSTSLRSRLQSAQSIHQGTQMPTAAERRALEGVPAALDSAVARVDRVVSERIPELRTALDAAGVPWTPGRSIGGG